VLFDTITIKGQGVRYDREPAHQQRTLGGFPRLPPRRWALVWNRRHLERILTDYLQHYNTARPLRGIGLNTPVPAAESPPASIQQLRHVERADVLGGLIHEYRHAA
jgi:hypothetical protein